MIQVWVDCDGVLADFDSHVTKLTGVRPREFEDSVGTPGFWKHLQGIPKFYREMPLMPDARILMDGLKALRPIILTGCPLGEWAEAQKMAWARDHFPGVPMITCMSKDKFIYCQPGDILIDDYSKYMSPWISAGGTFIKHISAERSLKEVEETLGRSK